MRLALLTACVCLLAATVPSAQSPAPERTKPLKSLDVSLIDTSVDACTNFYNTPAAGGARTTPCLATRRAGGVSTSCAS